MDRDLVALTRSSARDDDVVLFDGATYVTAYPWEVQECGEVVAIGTVGEVRESVERERRECDAAVLAPEGAHP